MQCMNQRQGINNLFFISLYVSEIYMPPKDINYRYRIRVPNIPDSDLGWTSISQSKELDKILDPETSDMSYVMNPSGTYELEPIPVHPTDKDDTVLPCWTISALISLMPGGVQISTPVQKGDNFEIVCIVKEGERFITLEGEGDALISACIKIVKQLVDIDYIKVGKEKFLKDVWGKVAECPKDWRLGQSVFNIVDSEYGVAKEVLVKDEIDCYYDDEYIDMFLEKAWIRYKQKKEEVC